MEQGQELPSRPARQWLRWIAVGGLALLIVPSLLLAALQLGIQGNLLYGTLTRGTTIELWHLMALFVIALCSTAIVLAVIAIRSGRMLLALLSSTLWVPGFIVFGPQICDTEHACAISIQRVLPPEAAYWSIRIRPVDDANEVRELARSELWERGVDNSPFRITRFDDHWLVSTINADGAAGPYAVSVDARTGDANLVPCPSDLIRCGMEWPTLSDGRRRFTNADLGISAVFAEGQPVCVLRGEDDAPRGFSAEFRDPGAACDEGAPDRRMGVELSWHPRRSCPVPAAPTLAWGPLTPETRAHFTGGQPRLEGMMFIVCELHADRPPDISIPHQIEILVLAIPDADPSIPSVLPIEAFLVTTSDDLARDVRMFGAFLQNLTITSPADAPPL